MKTLILTVGLPRSGKTTWAQDQGYPVVCPDAIRLAMHGARFISSAEPLVWAIAKIMVAALFLAGHHLVIVDATNNTKKRRDEWKSNSWEIRTEVFPESAVVCVARAENDDRFDLVPVIERMDRESDWRGKGAL